MERYTAEIALDGKSSLHLTFFPNRKELEEHVADNPSAVNLLGHQDDLDLRYYGMSLTTLKGVEKVSEVVLGLLVNYQPKLALWNEARRVFCGVDESIVSLAWHKTSVDYQTADILFWGFTWSPDRDLLLTLEEVGVRCFDTEGQVVWHWGMADVLGKVEIHKDTVDIAHYDGSHPVTLDLKTGKPLG